MRWPLSEARIPKPSEETKEDETDDQAIMGVASILNQSSSSEEDLQSPKSKSYKQSMAMDGKILLRGAIYRITNQNDGPFSFEGGRAVKFQGNSTVSFDTFLDAYNHAIQNGFLPSNEIEDWFQFILSAEEPCQRKKVLMTFERDEGSFMNAACLPVGGGASCMPKFDLSASSSISKSSSRNSLTRSMNNTTPKNNGGGTEAQVTGMEPNSYLRAAIFRAAGSSQDFPFIFEGGRMFGKPPHHFASFLDAYNFATENQFEAEAHKTEDWFKFVEEAESDSEEKRLLAVFSKLYLY